MKLFAARVHNFIDYGFVGVGMQRCANARRIVDLKEGHLIAFDERLDDQVPAIGRLALDGANRDRLDLGIPSAYNRQGGFQRGKRGSHPNSRPRSITRRGCAHANPAAEGYGGAQMPGRPSMLTALCVST